MDAINKEKSSNKSSNEEKENHPQRQPLKIECHPSTREIRVWSMLQIISGRLEFLHPRFVSMPT